MKELMKIIVLLFIPFFLQAQSYDCTPNCINSITTTEDVNVTFGTGCNINLTVEKQLCEDGNVIVKVLSINSFDYSGCGEPGPGVLMIQAIHGLIVDNPLNLTAGIHRFVYPSCWKYFDSPTNSIAVPCQSEFCCEIEITYEEKCNRILPTHVKTKGINSCFDSQGQNNEFGCQNACKNVLGDIEQDIRGLNENN